MEKLKLYSFWINRYGIDEMWKAVVTDSFDKALLELNYNPYVLRSEDYDPNDPFYDVSNWEIEARGPGWKAYSRDGEGIIECDRDADLRQVHEEYMKKTAV